MSKTPTPLRPNTGTETDTITFRHPQHSITSKTSKRTTSNQTRYKDPSYQNTIYRNPSYQDASCRNPRTPAAMTTGHYPYPQNPITSKDTKRNHSYLDQNPGTFIARATDQREQSSYKHQNPETPTAMTTGLYPNPQHPTTGTTTVDPPTQSVHTS